MLQRQSTIISTIMSTYKAPVTASLLPSTTPATTTAALSTAAEILKLGGLVAFPTETVYGLGASALSEEAVKSIYAAKGRPSDNPLIVHVASREMLHDLIPGGEEGIPELYKPLLDRFWPGALTLIFPLTLANGRAPPRSTVARSVTCGLPSLAIRMPSHPLALALIKACHLPLAAPSANLSSRPSPTTAQHVLHDLGTNRGVGAILDGGSCQVGLESTVVDLVLETGELRVLRAGGVSVEDLSECLRKAGFDGVEKGKRGIKVYKKDFTSQELEDKPTTPGMKYKHYSPSNSRVVLVKRRQTSPSDPTATTTAVPSLSDVIHSSLPSPSSPPQHQYVGLMLSSQTLSLYPLGPPTPSPTLFANPTPLPSLSNTNLSVLPYSIGSASRPLEAAQRLFSGLRYFDSLDLGAGKVGVDLIVLECVDEVGVGLAVMERARKAAGGEVELEFV